MASVFIKDPNAVLDYEIDWSSWLRDGDTITASEWIVDDGLDEVGTTFTDTSALVWLSGGTVRTKYRATNRVTTADGRTDDRSIWVVVNEK